MIKPPSTRDPRSSMHVSGPKRISHSCGYWLSHEISAPRSTMPCLISKTIGVPPVSAYETAMLRSVVVDMKPPSTPPRTFSLLGCQKGSGRSPFAEPR